ncbi:MAG: hypothetical protein E4H02_02030 [Lentisphaerales bacterium]|nr:MAG: hypothetical protein E4H02_02030 [Lentisphaerales bacterium]
MRSRFAIRSWRRLPKKRGSTFSARPTPIAGPYSPLTESPVTPDDWQCLDGTLHVDESGAPWIVFCHEWGQVHNGAMYAMQLSHNLMERAVFLEITDEGDSLRLKPH